MTETKICTRCLYTSDHALGITFDEQGICSGCRIHEEKDSLNWQARWEKLTELVKPYRNAQGTNYDCIIPVTGANDSHFIVHLAKNKLKLNPLLVTYNKYFNTPLGIRNLANLRIKFDCDILVQNVNPISVKKITRTTLLQFGSDYWHCLAGHTVFPVQTAVHYKVPLIIWGAHQGLEQVGMFSHEHEVEMTRRYRKDHDLMGHEADDLISVNNTLREEDIWQYRYPSDTDLNAVGVRGIYLGNFLRWDPKAQHEQMMRDFDYRTAAFERTFDCYDHVDCYNYMDIHDILKLYKHGFSKVTDHVCREIRFGRITREEGMALVKKHEHAPLKHLDLFRDWLGMEERALYFLLDRARSPKHWIETRPGEFKFNGASECFPTSSSAKLATIFKANDKFDYDRPRGYVIIGKGYP